MKIALNGTAYDELSSGARDRFLNLYAAVGEQCAGAHEFIVYSPREFSLVTAFRGPVNKGGLTPFSPHRPLHRFLYSRGWFKRRLRQDAADLFVTDHFPVIDGPARGTLLTIHDLRYLVLEDAGSALRRAWFKARFAMTVSRARAVVTVSHTMREEIIERLGVPEDRVHVVGNGVSREFRRAAPEEIEGLRDRRGLPPDYLLYLGVLEPRKNLGLLLDLYGADRTGDLPPLVIAGRGGPEERSLRARIAREGIEDRIHFTGYVPEADIRALYSGAAALLMPSVYEGFGIPVLQAFACETPVVCSNAGALAEVAGEAALLRDPHDPEAWSEAVTSVLDDGDLRARLAAAGRRRAEEYSWSAAAMSFLKVLDTL